MSFFWSILFYLLVIREPKEQPHYKKKGVSNVASVKSLKESDSKI